MPMRRSPPQAHTYAHTYTRARTHTQSRRPRLSPPGPCHLLRPSMTQGSQKEDCATSWFWQRVPPSPSRLVSDDSQASCLFDHFKKLGFCQVFSWAVGTRGAGKAGQEHPSAETQEEAGMRPGVGGWGTPSGNQRDLLACSRQVSPAPGCGGP